MLGCTNVSSLNLEDLSISLNGSNAITYNGITAKSLNITASSIGAAASNHNHDNLYSKLNHTHNYIPTAGGYLTGDIIFSKSTTGIRWAMNTDVCGIYFKNDSDADSDSYMLFYTGDNVNEYFRWAHFKAQNNPKETWMTLKSDGLRIKGNIWTNQSLAPLASTAMISTEKSVTSDETKLWAY